ncbi:venom acid phosphatase [Calliopsis andreniformis]|uniref:venom acid phosphatase n=1 Tax=Calliopsis andreniformis TaxID=337506 RepID=UPI003FCE8DFD
MKATLVLTFQKNIFNMISSCVRKGSLAMYVTISLVIVIFVTTVEAELRLVNVLFRHGDRTPDDIPNEKYAKDPYLHYDFYPMGRGELTNPGKMREYTLGKVLKERYSEFLGDTYLHQAVSSLSSDYDRTKMSLQLVLAALYPPDKLQQWNANLNWQPIPTRYLRRTEDNIFLGDECPLYLHEYNRVLNSPEGKAALSKYSGFMRQLSEWTGENITTPWDMYYVYHTLMAEYSMGLVLPDWAYEIFPYGELWNATVFAYEIANYSPLEKRLSAGPYLRRITKAMLNAASSVSNDERKIYLYAGHETNIAAILIALKVYYPHVPEYSSCVMVELHEIDNEYYIQVLYYLGIPSKTIELQLPGCSKLCPLGTFLDLTEDIIPSNEDLICDKDLTDSYTNQKSPGETDKLKYNLIRTAKAIQNDQKKV